MLKLMLAVTIALYVILPNVIICAMQGAFPDDAFGWRGCCKCGTAFVPTWVSDVGIVAVIGVLTVVGFNEIRKK